MGKKGAQIETVCLSAQVPAAVRQAVGALQGGELVAFATDTVYGLGAHGLLTEAVAQLYLVKGRPAHLPIPLLLPDAIALRDVCVEIPPVAWRIADRFWPGGLSLILHSSPVVPTTVTAGGSTVAVRVPDHPLVRELCHRLGAPLAATSANRHGQQASTTATEVQAVLGGRIPLILDGGACPGGVASTVLDLTVSPPAILRPGPVTAEQLATVVPVRQ